MAPLPVDNTARYKIFYTVAGVQHTQEVRTGIVSPSAFAVAADAYYTALATQVYSLVIDDVQFAGSGSSIFNSVANPFTGNTYGSGSYSNNGERALYYDFVGRSTGGRRMRFAQFGAKNYGLDFRYSAGENADLDAALAIIDGTASMWLAIDGLKPVMKTYINAGYNAYWQRAVR